MGKSTSNKWSIEDYRNEWLKYKDKSASFKLNVSKKTWSNFLKTFMVYNKK